MKEKEFYEMDELQNDIKAIKEDTQMLKDYCNLMQRVKELKEKRG